MCPPSLDAVRVFSHMSERYGYRIANGQDHLQGRVFRLGHMGALTNRDVLGLLEHVELTLRDLGYHRARVGVGLQVAEQILSGGRPSPLRERAMNDAPRS